MRKNPETAAYAAIVFVNIIWGLSFIASKYALQSGFTPFILTTIRFAMSGALLLPVCLLREGRPKFSQREWLLLFLAGIFGISLYFLFEYQGLRHTTASNASLILAAIPAMTMIYAAIRHKVRYRAQVWLGVLASLVGVYLVVRYGAPDGNSSDALLGNVLLLGACLCWVAYIELTSYLSATHSSLSLSCYQGILAVVTLIPLCFTERMDWHQISPLGLWATLFLGVVCSALCFILYTYATKRLQPVRTALFINLNPLSAVIGGVLLLDERMSLAQCVGGALILCSILYVNHALRVRG